MLTYSKIELPSMLLLQNAKHISFTISSINVLYFGSYLLIIFAEPFRPINILWERTMSGFNPNLTAYSLNLQVRIYIHTSHIERLIAEKIIDFSLFCRYFLTQPKLFLEDKLCCFQRNYLFKQCAPSIDMTKLKNSVTYGQLLWFMIINRYETYNITCPPS